LRIEASPGAIPNATKAAILDIAGAGLQSDAKTDDWGI